MFFDVKSLAKIKHQETQHAELDWIKALEGARQSLKQIEIDFETLEQIALASSSPSRFTMMTRLIYQYGKLHRTGEPVGDLILEYTNRSPFSLSEWVEAIQAFYNWLTDHNRKIDFLLMLNYLDCCAASPDARDGGQSLASLLEDMLKINGFDG